MNARLPTHFPRVVLAACIATWLAAEIARLRPSRAPAPPAVAAAGSRATETPRPAGPPPRPAPHGTSASQARAVTAALVASIEAQSDAAGLAVLRSITNALPPGWEDGFVLHDCLLGVVALTDLARMQSTRTPSAMDIDPAGPHPVDTLDDAGRAHVEFVSGFLVRWLARKHPALGEGTIRAILREHTLGIDPMLGAYDLVPPAEARRSLGLPEPAAEPDLSGAIPESMRGKYGPSPKTPP